MFNRKDIRYSLCERRVFIGESDHILLLSLNTCMESSIALYIDGDGIEITRHDPTPKE